MAHIEEGFWDRGERDALAYAQGLRRPRRDHLGHRGRAPAAAPASRPGRALHLLHTQTEGVVEQLRRAKDAGQDVSRRAQPVGPLPRQRLGEHRAARLVRAVLLRAGEEHRAALGGARRRHDRPDLDRSRAAHCARRRSPAGRTAGRPTRARRRPSSTCRCSSTPRAPGGSPLERVVDARRDRSGPPLRAGAKGRLEVGCDADIAVVDLDGRARDPRRDRPQQDRLHALRRQAVHGVVDTTLVRGRVVYADGSVVGDRGWGRQARPAVPAAAQPVDRRIRKEHRLMATRFGLLVPHFGVEADQDLLIEGARAGRSPGLRFALGPRPPRLPSTWHGGHGPDVHRAVRDPDLPGRRDREDRPRRGDDHPVPPPDQHGLQRRLDVVDDPAAVRPRDRRRQLPARVRRDRPGRPEAARADEGADAHRPPAVVRRDRSSGTASSTTSRTSTSSRSPSTRCRSGGAARRPPRPASRSTSARAGCPAGSRSRPTRRGSPRSAR